MTLRRTIGTLLAVCLVGAAALAVVAQDATLTPDPAVVPTTDAAGNIGPVATQDMNAQAGQNGQGGPMRGSAMAPIMDASGAQIGWASFSDAMGMLGGPGNPGANMTPMAPDVSGTPVMPPMGGNGKILVTVQLQSTTLTPGFHGMHIHSIGNCGDAGQGPFSAAGSHLATTGMQHPQHNGDASTILVNADGTGYVSFETDRFTMADLLDADGSAIIVHALPDNYANIPSRYGTADAETLDAGDSGPRVACGAVQAGQAGITGPGMTGNTTANTVPTIDPATMPTTDPALMPTLDPNAAPTTDPSMLPTATTSS